MRAFVLAVVGLGALLVLDLSDFNERQRALDDGLISKRFIRKGSHGKILSDNFIGYTYKKYNTHKVQTTLYLLNAQIIAAKGEVAFDAPRHFYSLDNVLNSIILRAYIADDDYCQGMEVTDNLENLTEASITSSNWDLDHGFVLYKDGSFPATPNRPLSG